jgi:L-alanine-DL-glutamate epimerase-like enolase superfamily enzyme
MAFHVVRLKTYRLTRVVDPALFIVGSAGEHRLSRFLVVQAELGDGAVGWGEATVAPRWSGETQRGAEALIEDYLAPALAGHALASPGDATRLMDRIVRRNPFTKAAIEAALWDAWARSRGQPLWSALDPDRDAPAFSVIPLRGSIAALPPDEAVARAQLLRDRGLRAFKVKVGRDPTAREDPPPPAPRSFADEVLRLTDGPRWRQEEPTLEDSAALEADVERVRAVREAIGDEAKLAVDANGGWSEDEALTALRSMADCRLQYVEQPVPAGDVEGMARIRAESGLPVMADEAVWTLADLQRLIRADAIDLLNLYPGKMAGLARCRAIAAWAHDAGLRCALGSNLETEIGTAAALHLAAAVPELPLVELHCDLIGPLYYHQPSARPPLRLFEGGWLLPEGPGTGLEYVDEE